MRRSSSACGGIVWRRISSKYGEAGEPESSIDVAHVLRVQAPEAACEVPLAGGGELAEDALGVEGRRVGQVAERRQVAVDRVGVAGDHGPGQRPLVLQVVGVHAADQAEVQEADAAVVGQQVVAGMRVAGGDALAPQQPVEEPEADLGEAVALGLGQLLDLAEAAARRRTR